MTKKRMANWCRDEWTSPTSRPSSDHEAKTQYLSSWLLAQAPWMTTREQGTLRNYFDPGQ